MSDLPTPKYRIGETVYSPSIAPTTTMLPCPDCLGTRRWRAISPAGEDHEIECPRCTDQYARSGRDELPSLHVQRYEPVVHRLTVGSITVKTHPYSGDDNVEYMAEETGVGSGSIYCERNLYPTEDSARAKAEVDAHLKNAEIDATPGVTKARKFSGLTCTTAAMTALKDGIFHSWEAFRGLRYAIEGHLPERESDDNEEQTEIREEIERYGRYGGTHYPLERHPIDALIEAATSGDKVELAMTISNLKRLAGFADKPEDPPCTCEYVGRYSRKPDCPRHGTKGEAR